MKLIEKIDSISLFLNQGRNYNVRDIAGRRNIFISMGSNMYSESLIDLLKKFLYEPRYSFKLFWRSEKDNIESVLKNIELNSENFIFNNNFERKRFLNYIFFKAIDTLFQENIQITSEFYDFLKKDIDYNIYFSILEKDFISIFTSLGINFDTLNGRCIYFSEIENPNIKIPKLIINFPTNDYDFVLDTLESFLKWHKKLLNYRFSNEVSMMFLEKFRKTSFIFERQQSD
ncbi:MAG: hypothetical protein BAJALOKI1v1_1100010 [Promethearchaeota archaeon]|nr:MAG: hypothetical protein BAJALOKI1v1_1100010 [Candidatus Lokiarchaeota archaeon]